MDLQIHDVKELSIEGGYVYSDEGKDKKIKIKINGYDNYITLYCTDDVKVGVTTGVFSEPCCPLHGTQLDLWLEDEDNL